MVRNSMFAERLMSGCAAMVMVAAAAPVMAQTRDFNVPAGPAEVTVPIFAKQADTQVIGSARELRGKRTNAVQGQYTVDEALGLMLSGTDLDSSTDAGNVITIGVVRRPAASGGGDEGADPSSGVSEILVIGSRSQNADVRRTEDDAQPYVVFNREEVESSQATTVEEFLRNRLPQNAGFAGSNAQSDVRRSTTSNFNLRGLGSDQTLILVNGRRMANINTVGNAPGQSDINGIPLGSIERIEILPSSAGGIYGGNAVGGVINIILRSDYRGIDIAATYNDTVDFEAPTVRLDLNGGFSLEDGRTTVIFGASLSRSGTLRVGERLDFVSRGIDLYRSNVDIFAPGEVPPIGNGVNISSVSGENLVLRPEYGGASLGSNLTSLPLNYGGVTTDNGALLIENAGIFNLSAPRDVNGTGRGLLAAPAITSGNISIRRNFSSWLDVFAEYGHSENKGKTYSVGDLPSELVLSPSSPNNPFNQSIYVTYPLTGVSRPYNSKSASDRLTVGSIFRLPKSWSVSAEYTKSWSKYSTSGYFRLVPNDIFNCFVDGSASCGGAVGLNPLQPPLDIEPYIFADPSQIAGPNRATFENPVLRASGPLFKLPGGEATLNMSVQREASNIGLAKNSYTDGTENGRLYTFAPKRRQSTTSEYAELVLPLVSASAGIPLVRELELRGAVRHDSYLTVAPPAGQSYIDYPFFGSNITILGGYGEIYTGDPNLEIPSFTSVESRFKNTSFTAAGRWSPIDGVMFRASYATGFLPPNVVQISTSEAQYAPFFLDPLRGNELVDYVVTYAYGQGSATIRPEKSKTLSAGIILTPFDGFRFSADYTRIKKTDEIGDIPIDFLLANPDLFPGRVTRGPASDGFPVGKIERIDVSATNLLRSQVQSVDFQADYRFETERAGKFRVYGVASWQPDTVRQVVVDSPAVNYSGYSNGPLKWSGNGGIDWELGNLGVQWNAQFYDSYYVYPANGFASLPDILTARQGSRRIPSQLYNDIYVSYAFNDAAGALDGVKVAFGVQNVFAHKPPAIAVSGYDQTSYSTYGDPRLRRFTLSLKKSFGSK